MRIKLFQKPEILEQLVLKNDEQYYWNVDILKNRPSNSPKFQVNFFYTIISTLVLTN